MKMLDVNMVREDGGGGETAVAATINLDYLRTFYARHDENKPGTRLTFADGKGFAVTNTPDEIKAAAVAAGLHLLSVAMVRKNQPMPEYGGDFTPGIDDTDADGEPAAPPAPVEATDPAEINLAYLRAFYPRHEGRGEGTRLTFADGGGFAVTTPYATVREGAQGLTAH